MTTFLIVVGVCTVSLAFMYGVIRLSAWSAGQDW